jgi:hypothetical protein
VFPKAIVPRKTHKPAAPREAVCLDFEIIEKIGAGERIRTVDPNLGNNRHHNSCKFPGMDGDVFIIVDQSLRTNYDARDMYYNSPSFAPLVTPVLPRPENWCWGNRA